MSYEVGIDPSSKYSAIALVKDGKLIDTWVWEPTDSKSAAWNLDNYYQWVIRILKMTRCSKAQIVCIEFLSVVRNMQAVRVISHYQAASVLAAKHAGRIVIEARVTSARKEVLGKGNLSKEETNKLIKQMCKPYRFKPFKYGGGDETDATVLAMAGPGIAER